LVGVLAISLYVSGVSIGRKFVGGLPARTDVPKSNPCLRLPGKKCRRVPLRDEANQPVKSVPEAVAAVAELKKKLRQGELPVSQRTPQFSEYVSHYIDSLKTITTKKIKTIKHEECILNGWANSIGDLRLNQITLRHISAYVTQRKQAHLNNRTVNLDVLTLNNCLKFSKREGCLMRASFRRELRRGTSERRFHDILEILKLPI
jgi:hypothetical protein